MGNENVKTILYNWGDTLENNQLKNNKPLKIKNNSTEEELKIIELETQIEKQKLIDKFFSIGSNVYLEELKDFRKELESFCALTNDLDIKRLLIVTEMFEINSRSKEIYTLSDEFNTLFSELYHKNNMTFLEIRLLVIMFIASDEPEEVFLVTEQLIKSLEYHENNPNYTKVRFCVYNNAADTLMYVRTKLNQSYSEEHYDPNLISYLSNAIVLGKKLDDKFWVSLNELRLGIVLENNGMINNSILDFKSLNDKTVDKVIMSELRDYNIEY